MANPTKYTRLVDYTPATLPDLRSDLNPEFDALVVSVDEIVEALKDVRASDGGMQNGIVDLDSLAQETKDEVEGAGVEADKAKVSADAAAQSASEAAASASQADTAATNAGNSETAAETARVLAESARDTAQKHRDDALGYSTSAFKYRNEAEAAASSAADAVRKAPNDVAATVFADGRDWGALALTEPFSDEEIPVVRVDLAAGSSTIDLGGVV